MHVEVQVEVEQLFSFLGFFGVFWGLVFVRGFGFLCVVFLGGVGGWGGVGVAGGGWFGALVHCCFF